MNNMQRTFTTHQRNQPNQKWKKMNRYFTEDI